VILHTIPPQIRFVVQWARTGNISQADHTIYCTVPTKYAYSRFGVSRANYMQRRGQVSKPVMRTCIMRFRLRLGEHKKATSSPDNLSEVPFILNFFPFGFIYILQSCCKCEKIAYKPDQTIYFLKICIGQTKGSEPEKSEPEMHRATAPA
jgi:hypothetical protein